MDFMKKVLAVFTKSVTDTSVKGKINSTDIAKVAKTSTIVGIAGGLTYFASHLAPDTLGHYQPFVMLGLTALIDFVNKWLKDNDVKE